MADTGAYDNWRAIAEKALKGAPFESLLTPEIGLTGAEGLIDPLSMPAEPVYAGRATAGPWTALQRVDHDGCDAVAALENGASGLSLVFAGAPGAHGRGLTANSVAALDAALKGVRLELIPLTIEAGTNGAAALALVLALCAERGTVPLALHAGLDPHGAAAFAGAPVAMPLAEAVTLYEDRELAGAALCADGRVAAEAGATPAHEIAFALTAMAAMLAELDKAGIGPERALPQISVALGADADQFATMAKLRAMRRLHAMIADACGVTTSLHITATTTARMLSFTDPHTNLLRLTIAAMGSALGGADAIEVLPFDGIGAPFAARMARNIQTLMLEEAHIARLSDPGAGSGTIEMLTDTIAEAAWRLFQENGAGDPAWLSDGTFAQMAATAAARERTIIGVTRHQPPEPAEVDRPATPTPPDGEPTAGATLADLQALAAAGTALSLSAPVPGAGAVTPVRAAAAFEPDARTEP
ncbi:methylmalonyl-CoA mutase family protein [Acuticoccus sp. MNP-M23]|uniref:methylmalonyl-CoA mutase family protein n=1 Tax=Acuticoccus sp. MNP-M23 TaxID=3072793 RepID=UPI0028149FF1|nr:methylmalonyl-CoA mutase family protein [Acuticoccus sp. MNP-M23]WMS41491.1 methylmalonyl-CoA mutase family protein [Acuticoccus sp. MNP-M23]